MKTFKNHINLIYPLTFLLLLFTLLGSAQVISKDPKDLFIAGSESISFQSKINNSEYKLYVNLPEGYDNDSTKTYPVFYALDGYRVFDITTRIYKGLRFDGFAPEMIIIGINNSGSRATNPTLHRTRDLTPTAIKRLSTSGGASNFLKVLSDEILPLIDRLYRSDKTNRTLAGTSHAGLFAHYTLFTQPTLFNSYIINNPTFRYDDGYSYKLEEDFYKKNKSLNAKIILLSGEFDDILNITKMVDQIKAHDYDNMTLGFRMVKNMGHLGGEAEAINQGMRFVNRLPTIMLPKEELREYCGTYKYRDYIYEIIIRDGQLTLVHENDPKGVKIQAINKSEFAFLGKYFDFRFDRNENGKVISFFSELRATPSISRTYLKIK